MYNLVTSKAPYITPGKVEPAFHYLSSNSYNNQNNETNKTNGDSIIKKGAGSSKVNSKTTVPMLEDT
eukprot:UN01185